MGEEVNPILVGLIVVALVVVAVWLLARALH